MSPDTERGAARAVVREPDRIRWLARLTIRVRLRKECDSRSATTGYRRGRLRPPSRSLVRRLERTESILLGAAGENQWGQFN
jgi:hypothetical protein